MSDVHPDSPEGDEPADPYAAGDVRALKISFLSGALLGGIYGTNRYGFFSMQNVAMVGLGIITVVFVHALYVALAPARD